MTKLKDYKLCCYAITKTMNLLQNNSFNFDALYMRFQDYELLNYEIDDIFINFTLQIDNIDNIGNMKIKKYIFCTNKFDILLTIHSSNKIEIGFLMHKLDFLVDELNGISKYTMSDIENYFHDFEIKK